MAISAELVKQLRERTGVGLMECKRALQETNGNIDEAIDVLRKSGQLKAQKKADRIAAEGAVGIALSDDAKKAVMIENNCETDFVAMDENFVQFTEKVLQNALQNNLTTVEQVLESQINAGTVEALRQEVIIKTGENIQLRRMHFLTTDHQIAAYRHGRRIGVMVEYKGGDQALGKDIAMHIAASAPKVLKPSEVSEADIAKEKEILFAQAENSGKPKEVIEKMVQGQVQKYIKETSLLGQSFVKDPSLTIEKLLQNHKAEVLSFVRYAVGEGIEKKQENFAEEVLAQARKS